LRRHLSADAASADFGRIDRRPRLIGCQSVPRFFARVATFRLLVDYCRVGKGSNQAGRAE
jgi:hypothetical protein